jgi:disulfide bond formation protein DsbB
MFNLFTILSIIEILINAKFDVTKETVIVSTCLLFYAMYRYLATKESIIYIFKEFGKISKTKRYILNLSVPIYLILTGWIFYYTANIVKAMP